MGGNKKSFWNLPEQHGRSWRLVEGHGSLGKVMEPCVASSNASSSVLSKVFPLISSLFWCHMYGVLVYKMLWDRKKILNIKKILKIIRLSMRPATGLCPHISLERILIYTVLI
jgi:hypothetical protein